VNLGLSDKRALVCGGSKGIGRAVAERLVAEGARVVTVSRNPPAVPVVGATPIEADLASAHGCRAAFDGAKKTLGGVDLLLVNAGGPPSGPTLSFDDDAWLKAFTTTLLSAVRICRMAAPEMAERRFGRIVAITSVSALEPIDGLVLSNALRPAVHGFLKTLSRDLAPTGVTVNVVAPGYTATSRLRELIPDERMPQFTSGLAMKRLIDPEETAATVAFLMSLPAASITGAVLPCDGGNLRAT
jgi:3-oxoacyl-[acyl-carrier protein] reductase